MTDAAARMDRMYRRQRRIYDLSRKFYLLGRDETIARLRPARGDRVLEIACGTGRNLIMAARLYPEARLFGLDISEAMLETAQTAIARAGLSSRIQVAQADATAFDPKALFGEAAFERVMLSYALSMIPPWRQAVSRALDVLAPGGSLHCVDFGDCSGLPTAFRTLLRRWLAAFDVKPRDDLARTLAELSAERGLRYETAGWMRGYAILGAARNGTMAQASRRPVESARQP